MQNNRIAWTWRCIFIMFVFFVRWQGTSLAERFPAPISKSTLSRERVRIFPRVKREHILSTAVASEEAGSATLISTNLKDGIQRLYRFAIDGAISVQIRDAVLAPDDTIVVIGRAESRDHKLAHFVARMETNGQIVNLIRTNPYRPKLLCVGPTGLVWTLGTVPDGMVSPSVRSLRRWDWSRGQVVAALPESDFPYAHTAENSKEYLECMAHSVVVLGGISNAMVSVSEDGTSLRRQAITGENSNVIVTGAVMSSDGDLVTSMVRFPNQAESTIELWSATMNSTGVMTWRKLYTERLLRGAPTIPIVFGADKDDLIICDQGMAMDKVPPLLELLWIPLPPRGR